MKWILLRFYTGVDILEVSRHLKKYSIINALKHISDPERIKGICFPETEKAKIANLLALSSEFFDSAIERQTNLNNVFLLQFNKQATDFFEERVKQSMHGVKFEDEFAYVDDLPDENRDKYIHAASKRFNSDLSEAINSIMEQEQVILRVCSEIHKQSSALKQSGMSYAQIQKDSELKKLTKQLALAYTVLDQKRKTHGVLNDMERSMFNRLRLEYKQFIGHSFVDEVRVQKDAVIVKTRMLVLRGVNIGRFRIIMKFNGTYGCKNLTQRPRRGGNSQYDHPHVKDIYIYCFGPSGYVIYDYIEKREFFLAFNKIWTRLNQYNHNDKYCSIDVFK